MCGTEKCYAMKTGLKYHVELHVEWEQRSGEDLRMLLWCPKWTPANESSPRRREKPVWKSDRGITRSSGTGLTLDAPKPHMTALGQPCPIWYRSLEVTHTGPCF